ncbi:phosphohydrolase [Isosphaeraceae bacterium EP7]
MHDQFKKRFRDGAKGASGDRLRLQIAVEAAKRLYPVIGPAEGADPGVLRDATEAEYYAAKRKAAAVLGHRVRPGDLPSDSEVRQQVLALARGGHDDETADDDAEGDSDEDAPEASFDRLADVIDRFAVYKLRLLPLESVKQDPRRHPEGDALYHSLQAYEQARAVRPYDEEFLLAALLHDVGKAVDPRDHIAAGVDALRGSVTPRTLWLVGHQKDAAGRGVARASAPESADWLEDLALLREVDEAARVPGVSVPTVEEALDALRALEAENDEGADEPPAEAEIQAPDDDTP